VHECFYIRSGQKFAVKRINKTRLSAFDLQLLTDELAIIGDLGHDNIFVLVDVFDTETMCHIVMEQATGGDVQQSIDVQGFLSESEAKVRRPTPFLSHSAPFSLSCTEWQARCRTATRME
jgi:hypothetical protein